VIASQTKDAIGAWKQAVPMPASMPGAVMLDLAGQGVEKVVQTRKNLIDLVVQQSAHGVEMSKERRHSASNWTDSAAEMVNETANCTVAAHKILLDFAAEQNRAALAVMKRQGGIAGSAPAAEAMDRLQRNVEAAIQTQKELMEAATKPLKAAVNKQAAA
jgi:hypothetical protein